MDPTNQSHSIPVNTRLSIDVFRHGRRKSRLEALTRVSSGRESRLEEPMRVSRLERSTRVSRLDETLIGLL